MESTDRDDATEELIRKVDAELAVLDVKSGGDRPRRTKVQVRCQGVDTSGKRCTRTRWVSHRKLYRLGAKNTFCHRHSGGQDAIHTKSSRRQWTWTAVLAMATAALSLLVVGVCLRKLWMVAIGLVAFSVAALCACLLGISVLGQRTSETLDVGQVLLTAAASIGTETSYERMAAIA